MAGTCKTLYYAVDNNGDIVYEMQEGKKLAELLGISTRYLQHLEATEQQLRGIFI